MTSRRAALAMLCLAPLAARAQQKVWRIGFFVLGTPLTHGAHFEAFRRRLRELGYAEGKNARFEPRWAGGKAEELSRLAAGLVKWSPDVILVSGNAAIRAAQQATASIPLVMASSNDPVEQGFVKSHAQPGGNLTGIDNMASDTSTKLVELARAVAPGASRAAVLRASNRAQRTMYDRIEAAAKHTKLALVPVIAASIAEAESGLAGIKGKVEVLIVMNDSLFFANRPKLAEVVTRTGLPSVFARSEHVEVGGLISYSSSLIEQYRRAATYIDRILKGARPGDLAIERPTVFELVVNLKTAKALGIRIPKSLLQRADRVIE